MSAKPNTEPDSMGADALIEKNDMLSAIRTHCNKHLRFLSGYRPTNETQSDFIRGEKYQLKQILDILNR